MRGLVEGVAKRFTGRSGEAVEALHDISLTVGDGEFITILEAYLVPWKEDMR